MYDFINIQHITALLTTYFMGLRSQFPEAEVIASSRCNAPTHYAGIEFKLSTTQVQISIAEDQFEDNVSLIMLDSTGQDILYKTRFSPRATREGLVIELGNFHKALRKCHSYVRMSM